MPSCSFRRVFPVLATGCREGMFLLLVATSYSEYLVPNDVTNKSSRMEKIEASIVMTGLLLFTSGKEDKVKLMGESIYNFK